MYISIYLFWILIKSDADYTHIVKYGEVKVETFILFYISTSCTFFYDPRLKHLKILNENKNY